MRRLLWLLLLPGGLLILAGIFVASVGVGLCWPWLRRMTASMGGPDAMRVAPVQPHGASPDSGQRVPWAACGDLGASTGEPWPRRPYPYEPDGTDRWGRTH